MGSRLAHFKVHFKVHLKVHFKVHLKVHLGSFWVIFGLFGVI